MIEISVSANPELKPCSEPIDTGVTLRKVSENNQGITAYNCVSSAFTDFQKFGTTFLKLQKQMKTAFTAPEALTATVKFYNESINPATTFLKIQEQMKPAFAVPEALTATVKLYNESINPATTFLKLQEQMKPAFAVPEALTATVKLYNERIDPSTTFLKIQEQMNPAFATCNTITTTFKQYIDSIEASEKLIKLQEEIEPGLVWSDKIATTFKQYKESIEAAATLRKVQDDIKREREILKLSFANYKSWEDEQKIYETDFGNAYYHEIRGIYEHIFDFQNIQIARLDKKIVKYKKFAIKTVFKSRIIDKRRTFRSQMRIIFKNLDDTHDGIGLFTQEINQQLSLKYHSKWNITQKRQVA